LLHHATRHPALATYKIAYAEMCSWLVTRYEKTTTNLNDFYVQRAKKSWAIDGDRNTAFFIEQ
jgi:hypothetical protein